jgi:hypothetical protein
MKEAGPFATSDRSQNRDTGNASLGGRHTVQRPGSGFGQLPSGSILPCVDVVTPRVKSLCRESLVKIPGQSKPVPAAKRCATMQQ